MNHTHDFPLDPVDDAILHGIADLFDTLDPPPATLDDNVVFAVSLAALDAEVATMLEHDGLALRTAEASPTDTVTFTSSALQLMVRTSEDPDTDGTLRVDGWVTGGGVDVALVAGTSARWTTSDAHGRVLWRGVPHGPVRFLLRPVGPGAKPVRTPVIEL